MTVFVIPPAFADIEQRRMPSKKKHARAAQLVPPPVASDYDTDTAYYTETQQQQLPVAPPPERSPAELNMLVLKRWYPDIQSILAIAPFAVLYKFSPETQQWDKCDTQGSLFVCQLIPPPNSMFPRYRVIILNRRNPQNFDLELVSTEDIEVTEEFVIIPFMDQETGISQIYGIWVFKDDDSAIDMREQIAKVILECAGLAEQGFSNRTQHEQCAELAFDQHVQAAEEHSMDGGNNHSKISQQSVQGQSIDLATLFARPGVQAETQRSVDDAYHSGQHRPQPQLSQPAADTAPFMNPGGFVMQNPQSYPGAQQNALLDLFKNAKRG